MWRPSVTAVLSGLFLAFVGNSILSVAKLFIPPNCTEPSSGGGTRPTESACFSSVLHGAGSGQTVQKTGIQLLLLTTEKARPSLEKDMQFWAHLDITDFDELQAVSSELTVPDKVVRNNGSLYLAILSVPIDESSKHLHSSPAKVWLKLASHPETTFNLVKLTHHHVPEAESFNLVSTSGSGSSSGTVPESKAEAKPRISRLHLMSKLRINIMTEPVQFGRKEPVPAEMAHMIRIYKGRYYLPMVYVDELSQRLEDLVQLNDTREAKAAGPEEAKLNRVNVKVDYAPVSWGKLRMLLQFSGSLVSMRSNLGFSAKDTDEIKGIFTDTSLPLLLTTFAVSALHLLFDFLAFKNDVAFWRGRTSMVGLSRRTLIWRAFSQSIIFLYLLDEETSMLVLVPAGVAALIEIWKLSKAFRLQRTKAVEETSTEQFDTEAMRYLSYLLYPLLAAGAVYSLLYTKHRSWWSWTVQSMVNGVYAFGFLFMLPQLFINYRLKSVAHLPWRAFMYKAFNTFIDDLFAFIITMPTAHRVACFRDDAVFLIYLYQRYLYPVDKSRLDVSTSIEEVTDSHELDAGPEPGQETAAGRPHQRKAKAE